MPSKAATLLLWLILMTNKLAACKNHHGYTKENKAFFFPKYRPEIFYDNKVLPEDIEVDAFIFKDQIQRLFYVMEGGYRPLSITVTPCSSSPLEWRLSHQPVPVSSTAAAYYQSDPWYNHVVRPKTPLHPSPSATYIGTERRSYTNPRAPPGLHVLELNSPVTTRAKVVVTTRSCTDYSFHPPLPTVHNVQLVKAKRNRVLISWKPSASAKPIDYCVTSNIVRNYNSLCAAKSDLLGDRFLTPPSGSGFGFQWEKSMKTVQSNFLTDVPKNNVSLICVGRKTWHMFRGLERGKTYYFDVFAIDTETNASTAYVGVKASVKSASKHNWIKDETLSFFTLDSNNGYSANTYYHRGKNAGAIMVFVQSCVGPGPVIFTVTQNNANSKSTEILSERIMDFKTLEIPHQTTKHNSSYPLMLNLQSSTKNPRSVQAWISSKKHSFPFPILPADKNVKVFDTLISCDSITIGWKASSDEKVKYCIYRSAIRDDIIRKTLGQPQNFCEQPVEVNVTRVNVLCRRYHRFSKRRFSNIIMQKVKGLQPNTTYLFEVQVTKMKGKMLPYEKVWASTRKVCPRERNGW